MSEPSRTPDAQALRSHLLRLRTLRGKDADGGAPPRLGEVKQFQAARLARTYADLAATPRYAQATRFFLDDLYGPKDFSGRDAAMLRIYPLLVRTLPESAVETAALAVEVDALSEELDRALAAALDPGPIDDESYARAYRGSARRSLRERQIELVGEVGERLDRLVARPLVSRTLRLMRTPARLAGLADLQSFLERGFEAFHSMGGAGEFIATVQTRERAIASRLFSSAPRPFSL